MHGSSSSDNIVRLSGTPVVFKRHKEKVKEKSKKREKKPEPQFRMIASLEKLTTMESIDRVPIQQSGPRLREDSFAPPTCPVQPPTFDAFIERNMMGKYVRDVWIDTHDLLNEPGGFVINFSRYGEPKALVKSLRIHLGIRNNNVKDRLVAENISDPIFPSLIKEVVPVVRPGTITITDDYAREIFRSLQSHPKLESLYAILEIKDSEDSYDEKQFEISNSPEFLRQFIQTYPTKLVKFHVEIPGISECYLPEWKFLLEQQCCLQEVICNFGVVMWYFYETGIWKNSGTLRKIVLRRLQTYDVATSKYVPFNWGTFSNCVRLMYLKVTCGCKVNREETQTSPSSPMSVFLHENFDDLPDHDYFLELHLGKIWVDPCLLEKFSWQRPNLALCLNCNDMEYYDGDLPITLYQRRPESQQLTKELRLLQLSRMDLSADIPEVESAKWFKTSRRHKSDSVQETPPTSPQKQFGSIVFGLFVAVIIALAVLFVIIFFKHMRGGHTYNNDNKTNANHSSTNNLLNTSHSPSTSHS